MVSRIWDKGTDFIASLLWGSGSLTTSVISLLFHTGPEISRANGWDWHLALAPEEYQLTDPFLASFVGIVDCGVR